MSGQRRQVRQERSKPVLAPSQVVAANLLLQSAYSRALHYLRGQWSKLVRYVDSGAWPISNNSYERAIRPFLTENKARLMSDIAEGASLSANLYLPIEPATPLASMLTDI